MATKHPQIKWAETETVLSVSLQVPNCTDEKIAVVGDTLTFEGTNSDGTYACSLKLKGEIDAEDTDTKYGVKARAVDFNLVKKEAGRWGRLLEDKALGKAFVKADWDKWIDEDDEEDGKTFNTDGMDRGMGGMPPGMGGMGGMPGMGGMGGMGGMPGMGGMGGMPGMPEGMDMAKMMEQIKAMQAAQGGGAGAPGADGGDIPTQEADSDDDDELPGLEGTD